MAVFHAVGGRRRSQTDDDRLPENSSELAALGSDVRESVAHSLKKRDARHKKLRLTIFPSENDAHPDIFHPGDTVKGRVDLLLTKDIKARVLVVAFRGHFAESRSRLPPSLFPQVLEELETEFHAKPTAKAAATLASASCVTPLPVSSLASLPFHSPGSCYYRFLDCQHVVWGNAKDDETDGVPDNEPSCRTGGAASRSEKENKNSLRRSASIALKKAFACSSSTSPTTTTNSHDLRPLSFGTAFTSKSPGAGSLCFVQTIAAMPVFAVGATGSGYNPEVPAKCSGALAKIAPLSFESGVLKKGVRSFHFSFKIPRNVPSSYQADNPKTMQEIRVQYELSARLFKAEFPMDRRVSCSRLHLIRVEDNLVDPYSVSSLSVQARSETNNEKDVIGTRLGYTKKCKEKGKAKEQHPIGVRVQVERGVVAPGQIVPVRIRVDGLPDCHCVPTVEVKLRKMVRYGSPQFPGLYSEDVSYAPTPTISRTTPDRLGVELTTQLSIPGIYSRRPRRLLISGTGDAPEDAATLGSGKIGSCATSASGSYVTLPIDSSTHDPVEARGYRVAYPPTVPHGLFPFISVLYVVRVKVTVSETRSVELNQSQFSPVSDFPMSTPPLAQHSSAPDVCLAANPVISDADNGYFNIPLTESPSPTLSSTSIASSDFSRITGAEEESMPTSASSLLSMEDARLAKGASWERALSSSSPPRRKSTVVGPVRVSSFPSSKQSVRRWRPALRRLPAPSVRGGKNCHAENLFVLTGAHTPAGQGKFPAGAKSQVVELDVGIVVAAPRRKKPGPFLGREEELEEEDLEISLAGPSSPPLLPPLTSG